MSQKPDRPTREGLPVLSGLAALVTVGLLVGLVLGGVAWAGARVLGLGGSAGSATEQTSEAQGDVLVLPKPRRTKAADGPLITLGPAPGGRDQKSGSASKKQETKKPRQNQQRITLSAGQRSVGVMGRIDLTGVYRGGDGRILQVQRFQDGSWEDFPVTAAVDGTKFSTYVMTGRTGPNRFRVADNDNTRTSNEVRVVVG